MNQQPEEWKAVPRYPNYEASSHGRIRSVFNGAPRVLRTYQSPIGYWYLRPCVNGRTLNAFVHRMVCEAFHGPCPDGLQCAHGDGNRSNNTPLNLRWATAGDNTREKFTHGTMPVGEDTNSAKLTADQVREIRRRRANGEKRVVLAKEFGVSGWTIRNIMIGKVWRHVK